MLGLALNNRVALSHFPECKGSRLAAILVESEVFSSYFTRRLPCEQVVQIVVAHPLKFDQAQWLEI